MIVYNNAITLEIHYGSTLFEVQDSKIISSRFVPLNLK
jgi:hypothetical protein